LRKSLAIGLLIIIALLPAGCSQSPPPPEARPKIATTIFPLYDIAGNIVGDRLEVVGILPPGASPHTYSPTPRQIKELGGVKVVFSIGHGLDEWTVVLLDTLPNLEKVVVDKGVRLVESSESDEDGKTGAGRERSESANPHYWLAIENGKRIAQNIAEEMIRLDPANESYYRANLEGYLSKLDAAKARIKGRIGGLARKDMITFHDAWAYFADEFGLEIVGAFEPFPGKQPTPRYLAALQDKARSHGVRVLFSESQLSNQAVAAFVGDLGLKLYVLDPLGGVEGRGSYIELLEYNTDIIVKALSDG
jgi:zinc transport system substrate-binding protein